MLTQNNLSIITQSFFKGRAFEQVSGYKGTVFLLPSQEELHNL